MSIVGQMSALQVRKAAEGATGPPDGRLGSRSRSSSRGSEHPASRGMSRGGARPADDAQFASMSENNESEPLTKQDVLSVMARFFRSKEFILESYAFAEVTTPNGGGGGGGGAAAAPAAMEYFRLVVGVKAVDGSKKEYPFFVKKLAKDAPEHRARMFAKETELYPMLFEDFNKLLKDEKNQRAFKPAFYFAKPGVLVLEDLSTKGYYQIGRREYLDKEHLLAVMRSLAAFHAASIKFDEKLGKGETTPPPAAAAATAGKKTLAEVYPCVNDGDRSKAHPDAVFIDQGLKGLLALVDRLPGYARHELDQIKAELPDIVGKIHNYLQPSSKYNNVVTHANLCTNNIFFRRNEDNTLEAVLVDFGNVHYAPPAVDFVMLLHLNQRLVFRIKETYLLVQTYWNMVAEELDKGGVCTQKMLPINDFLKSCEEFVPFAVLHSPMYLLTYLLSGECPRSEEDASTAKAATDSFSKDGIYTVRMTETANEMIRTFIKLE